MFEEGDDNDITNENDFSDDEDAAELIIDDDEKESKDEGFKLLSYENILENIQNTVKKTIPILTKFEKARIMGVRLQQLAYGAKPRIDTTNMKSIKEIVAEELKQRKIPFIIKRPLPNGIAEYWKLEEFEDVS